MNMADEPSDHAAVSSVAGKLSRSSAAPANDDPLREPKDAPLELVKLAQQILHRRKLRVRFLDAATLDDGPWDILLTIYIAHSHGRHLTREDILKVGGLSTSVAVRWVYYLEQAGMIRPAVSSAALPFTGMRLELQTKDALDRYLSAVLSVQPGEV